MTASAILTDSCPECAWSGDADVYTDTDEGLVGWDCPDCGDFVTVRDLIPDEIPDAPF